MRAFVNRLFIFILPTILFPFFSFYVIKEIHEPFIIEKSIDTIITGDSHLQYSVNDSLLGNNMINISINSEGYFYSYYKIKVILENNPHIQNVWLGVNYHNLSSYYDDFLFNCFVFTRYYPLIDSKGYATILKNNPKAILATLNGIRNIFAYPYIGHYYEHKVASNQKVTSKSLKNRIRTQFGADGNFKEVSDLNVSYLTQIVLLCEQKKVNLVLVKPPLHKEYMNNVPHKYLYDQITTLYKVPIIDMENLEMGDDCYLPDGDHLTNKGALVATNWIKDNFTTLGKRK